MFKFMTGDVILDRFKDYKIRKNELEKVVQVDLLADKHMMIMDLCSSKRSAGFIDNRVKEFQLAWTKSRTGEK